MIFQTERLVVRAFSESDKDLFFKMMSNPNVMNPIPQKVMTKTESDLKFEELLTAKNPSLRKLWALTEKESNEFIGLCGFLKNDEEEDEIAYRLMERCWGNGYGTEIAKGLIEFGFTEMQSNKITADVNIANLKSVKILEKFLNPVREFYNERDKCVDRRYAIYKNEYPEN
jgi:RimJ/RimL family protein N-acetyltransferase